MSLRNPSFTSKANKFSDETAKPKAFLRKQSSGRDSLSVLQSQDTNPYYTDNPYPSTPLTPSRTRVNHNVTVEDVDNSDDDSNVSLRPSGERLPAPVFLDADEEGLRELRDHLFDMEEGGVYDEGEDSGSEFEFESDDDNEKVREVQTEADLEALVDLMEKTHCAALEDAWKREHGTKRMREGEGGAAWRWKMAHKPNKKQKNYFSIQKFWNQKGSPSKSTSPNSTLLIHSIFPKPSCHLPLQPLSPVPT